MTFVSNFIYRWFRARLHELVGRSTLQVCEAVQAMPTKLIRGIWIPEGK